MTRALFASLLVALVGPVASADEQTPDPVAVKELKKQLEELKKQQAELAKQIDATADKLKQAEEKGTGTARLTVTGVLEEEKGSGMYTVEVTGPGAKQTKVYVPAAEQVKLLAKLVGRRVTITGDLVVNTIHPNHHAALTLSKKSFHGVPAGEIGVVNCTVDVAPEPKPSGK
jgi:hypothetical protein